VPEPGVVWKDGQPYETAAPAESGESVRSDNRSIQPLAIPRSEIERGSDRRLNRAFQMMCQSIAFPTFGRNSCRCLYVHALYVVVRIDS